MPNAHSSDKICVSAWIPQTLTITEAASELRVSHWTVRRALRRNQLKHIRLGHRTVRIHRESFAQYKEARTR